jgi:rSAM/selenodomain-associated transferase 2
MIDLATTLDIVIPTLDAGSTIAHTISSLSAVRGVWPGRIVVCDGGSRDDTAAIARALGALVVASPPGRGTQLAAGAQGDSQWLLFLHSDTTLSADWLAAAERFMAMPENRRKAGYFRLRFDATAQMARLIERAVAWRCRVLGLPYGDQGLLIGRSFYQSLGGYRAIPLMEDVDLARRIGRHRLVALDAEAITSARRYERDGWISRPLRNLFCLALFLFGVSPQRIARLYY